MKPIDLHKTEIALGLHPMDVRTIAAHYNRLRGECSTNEDSIIVCPTVTAMCRWQWGS